MIPLHTKAVDIQTIHADWLQDKKVALDVLRLDKIHPVVSGNKWFKLKYYLQQAKEQDKSVVATFGGAWSNHIVAVAFASAAAGLRSIGIIRGERPAQLSATLVDAERYGMQLHFVSREAYRDKAAIVTGFTDEQLYWVDEGGFGATGVKGAAEIPGLCDIRKYSHIIAGVGTGTMLAGLVLSVTKDQQVVGISAMKGNHQLDEQVKQMVPGANASFEIVHNYHFGGFGKHPQQLIDYINSVYIHHHLPLDIVYTGKVFYAINDLTSKNNFEAGARLLMIHSGGLQGNRSLGEKVLAF